MKKIKKQIIIPVLLCSIIFSTINTFATVKLKQNYEWTFIDGFAYLYEDDKKICTDLRKYFEKFPSYMIAVNKLKNVVTVYAEDWKREYTIPLVSFICSCGKDTPTGIFSLDGEKQKWGAMFGNVYAKYATRIKNTILFHSLPYTKKNNYSLITEEYNGLGVVESAGCVRLLAKDAYWIYKNIDKGTTVYIYEDEVPGPFGTPTFQKIPANQKYDPTDPEIVK